MNRLDTTQIEFPKTSARTVSTLTSLTYVVSALGVGGIVAVGATSAYNPVDQTFAILARLPFAMLSVDAWTLMLAYLRRQAPTPLRIPIKTPLILAVLHLLAGTSGLHLIVFDRLYELRWIDDGIGHYEVGWLPGGGVVLLALVSLLLAVFEIRLSRWVLISEITAPPEAPVFKPDEPEDIELGTEHIYEAQVLLNNLGYDVTPISGELNLSTSEALREFQKSTGLEVTGTLTAKTMIDLRNRWREHEAESSPVMAVGEHAVKRTGSRIARLFRRS